MRGIVSGEMTRVGCGKRGVTHRAVNDEAPTLDNSVVRTGRMESAKADEGIVAMAGRQGGQQVAGNIGVVRVDGKAEVTDFDSTAHTSPHTTEYIGEIHFSISQN